MPVTGLETDQWGMRYIPAIREFTRGKADMKRDNYKMVRRVLLKRKAWVLCLMIANIQLLKPVVCGVFKMKKKLQIGSAFPVFKASVISLVLFTEQSLRKIFPANKPEFSL